MVERLLIATSLLIAAAASTGSAVRAQSDTPHWKAARVTFLLPTRVCDQYLMGTYVVVHDEDKMMRDEPCTTFYRVGATEKAEAVVSFHCIPKPRAPVTAPTLTTIPTGGVTTTTRTVTLVEYQLPGEAEAHGVPSR